MPFTVTPFVDLTHPIGPDTPVFPGDDPVRVRVLSDVRAGGPYTARRLKLGTHSGTHVDAPAHLLPDGSTVGDLPLDLWVGPAQLIDAVGFEGAAIGQAPRLLVAGCPDGIPVAWARSIVAAGIRLVGIDGPSFDPVASTDLPVHRLLLAAGVVLLESLRLAGAPRGPGTLYCLPLPVAGGDGAPARVLWEADRPFRPRGPGKWGTDEAAEGSR